MTANRKNVDKRLLLLIKFKGDFRNSAAFRLLPEIELIRY